MARTIEERLLETMGKTAKAIKRKALPVFLAAAMLYGGTCALPISRAEAGNPERKVNLNLKVSSKPEEADIYYAPIEKLDTIPSKEKYVHAGKTPLTLELLIHHPKGSPYTHWEPLTYHIIAEKERYKSTDAAFGNVGITFLRPSPDNKNYIKYGQWYSPKDKEKIFVNNPNLTNLNINYDLVFEFIKEGQEKVEEIKD